jgi:hypothetical protein
VYATGFGADGYRVRIASAALRDATGAAVAVKTLDRASATVGQYLPPASGMIIPVAPLAAGTLYHATVTFVGPRGPHVTYAWSFETGATG